MKFSVIDVIATHMNIRALPRSVRNQFEMIKVLEKRKSTVQDFQNKFGVKHATIYRYIDSINSILWDFQITKDYGVLSLVPAEEVDE